MYTYKCKLKQKCIYICIYIYVYISVIESLRTSKSSHEFPGVPRHRVRRLGLSPPCQQNANSCWNWASWPVFDVQCDIVYSSGGRLRIYGTTRRELCNDRRQTAPCCTGETRTKANERHQTQGTIPQSQRHYRKGKTTSSVVKNSCN